jgi:hypothetical protein
MILQIQNLKVIYPCFDCGCWLGSKCSYTGCDNIVVVIFCLRPGFVFDNKCSSCKLSKCVKCPESLLDIPGWIKRVFGSTSVSGLSCIPGLKDVWGSIISWEWGDVGARREIEAVSQEQDGEEHVLITQKQLIRATSSHETGNLWPTGVNFQIKERKN